LDGIPAEGGVGVGDEMGAEVRRITGGAPPAFPPKLTLPEAFLGAETPADENNEEACSGERVVVVGGSVSEG
jgi:hypothetical protein